MGSYFKGWQRETLYTPPAPLPPTPIKTVKIGGLGEFGFAETPGK